QEQLHDARREARNSPQLPGIDRVNDVDDLRSRYPHRLAGEARVGHVARMAAQKVVGHAPADAVELDALADDIAAGKLLVAAERQHLGRDHLQLQRHRETILRTAWAEAKEHLTGDEHLARRT